MRQPKVILTIAGSDSCGGAGIQADIKTIEALGGYAASVVTAVTAQNTQGVQQVYPLAPEVVTAQLDAVFADMKPAAIKIGMVHDEEIVHDIVSVILTYKPRYVVCDPVMFATSGACMASPDAVVAMMRDLFPLCTLITPNLPEASKLFGDDLTKYSDDELYEAGVMMARQFGCDVLIKGGHRDSNIMRDTLFCRDGRDTVFECDKIASRNLHGTGCTLSSAIATLLAQGRSLTRAIDMAKAYVTDAIDEARTWRLGKGSGPLCHNMGL